MRDSAHDYSEFVNETDDDKLAQLSRMALEQQTREAEVARLEAELAQANVALDNIAESGIPALMDEVGMQEFRTKDGLQIKVSEKLFYSLSKEKKDAALKWVDENGGGDLLRRSFEILFTKDQEVWASKFERDCKQRKKPLNITRQQAIAPATLKKFLTDLMTDGDDVPLELFGAFHRKRAKIST